VFQTPIIIHCVVPITLGTATQIPAQTTRVRSAGAQSTPRAQKTSTTSPSGYTTPYPTLSTLLPRNTRSLHNMYNVDTTNSF
jgi:hypothetical protein